MQVVQITDRNELFSFLKKDYCLYSYHIGDLDDFFFNNCKYFALVEDNDNKKIKEICLLFQGLGTPTVLALGISELFDSFIEKIIDSLPEKFFCHYLPKHENLFLQSYSMIDLGMHQKMRLVARPTIETTSEFPIIHVNHNHLKKLEELYAEAYPDTYFDKIMLDTGYYYGLENQNHKMIAVVGVHTYSKGYNLAVLGNITTHTNYRGKGYAKVLVKKIIEELSQTVTDISLNVKKSNISAIKLYEKFGFQRCVDYKEALFTKKKN